MVLVLFLVLFLFLFIHLVVVLVMFLFPVQGGVLFLVLAWLPPGFRSVLNVCCFVH